MEQQIIIVSLLACFIIIDKFIKPINSKCSLKNHKTKTFLLHTNNSSHTSNQNNQYRICTQLNQDIQIYLFCILYKLKQVRHIFNCFKCLLINSDFDSEIQTKTVRPFFTLLPIILNICLGQFYFGYGVAYFSSIDVQTIINYYSISISSEVAIGVFNGCTSVGAGIGSVFSSVFISKFSRKNSILVTNLIAIFAGIFIFIPNEICFTLMRLAQGFCIGIYSATIPMYVKQISPLVYFGPFGAFNQFFIAFGVFFSFLFSFTLQTIFADANDQFVLYYLFGFPLLIVIAQTILLLTKFSYQTPKYLVLKNKEKKQVIKLLSVLYYQEYLDQAYQDLIKNEQDKSFDIQRAKNFNIEDQNQKNEKEIKKSQIESANSHKDIQRNGKSPNSAIFVALFMALTQQLVGMNAVAIYGGQLTTQMLPSLKSIFPIIINLPPVFSTLIMSYLLSKIGRKTILMRGMIVISILCFIIGISFLLKEEYKNLSFALILVCQFIYMATFGISVGPILWIYMPEIVQSYVLPYSTLMNWIGSAIVLVLFPILKQSLPGKNPGWLFIWFSIYSLIGLIVYSKFVIQTKGKNQRQIYLIYRRITLF